MEAPQEPAVDPAAEPAAPVDEPTPEPAANPAEPVVEPTARAISHECTAPGGMLQSDAMHSCLGDGHVIVDIAPTTDASKVAAENTAQTRKAQQQGPTTGNGCIVHQQEQSSAHQEVPPC